MINQKNTLRMNTIMLIMRFLQKVKIGPKSSGMPILRKQAMMIVIILKSAMRLNLKEVKIGLMTSGMFILKSKIKSIKLSLTIIKRISMPISKTILKMKNTLTPMLLSLLSCTMNFDTNTSFQLYHGVLGFWGHHS